MKIIEYNLKGMVVSVPLISAIFCVVRMSASIELLR